MFKNILLLALIVLVVSVSVLFLLSSTTITAFLIRGYHAFPEILKSIAESGVVASVLMVTIELASRGAQETAANNLISKINENLFKAVYKRNISDGVVKEIEKSIFKSNVFRKGHELCYVIIPIDKAQDDDVDDIDHVLCETVSRYTIHNISGSEIPYRIESYFELPIDSRWEHMCEYTALRINGDDVIADAQIENNNVQLHAYYDIKMAIGEEVRVEIEGKHVKRTVDSEIWTSLMPSDGMRLQIITEGADICTYAHANHRRPLTELIKTTKAKIWHLNEFILPYQSVVFWWKDSTVNGDPEEGKDTAAT